MKDKFWSVAFVAMVVLIIGYFAFLADGGTSTCQAATRTQTEYKECVRQEKFEDVDNEASK